MKNQHNCAQITESHRPVVVITSQIQIDLCILNISTILEMLLSTLIITFLFA